MIKVVKEKERGPCCNMATVRPICYYLHKSECTLGSWNEQTLLL